LTVASDSIAEGNEAFRVVLSGAENATIASGTGTVTILDDDEPEAAVSIADASVVEGPTGTREAQFAVTLSAAVAHPVSVAWETASGTALAGRDFAWGSGKVSFPPGVASRTVTVTILGDRTPEPDETFQVVLSGPAGVALVDASAEGRIVNDDAAARDLGGDLRSDILWRHAGGALYVWQMDGTGLKSSSYLPPISLAWTIQGLGDFNGDGKADVLWREATSGATYLWLMDGASAIGQGYTASQADNTWAIKGVGDFDGDGNADILWRHTGGALYIWLMDGTGIKSSSYLSPISLAWTIRGLGDFNGDGTTDILWRESSSGGTYLWLMNGATAVATGYTASQADNTWVIQGVGDFDGDSRADILWRHTGGALYVWQMQATGIKTSNYLPPISLSWTIQQLGDFNGDGRADILWRETAGATYAWLMDGAVAVGAGYTATQADGTWVIQGR
jgi:hypothetical protein